MSDIIFGQVRFPFATQAEKIAEFRSNISATNLANGIQITWDADSMISEMMQSSPAILTNAPVYMLSTPELSNVSDGLTGSVLGKLNPEFREPVGAFSKRLTNFVCGAFEHGVELQTLAFSEGFSAVDDFKYATVALDDLHRFLQSEFTGANWLPSLWLTIKR